MGLTIGKLARTGNVNVETIRYYQRVGLIKEPEKPPIGYRQYPADYIARIHFIKRAQPLGFTLKEIAELLLLGDTHCDDVKTLAEQKRERIEAQIKDLNIMREVLGNLIDACNSNRSIDHCSIIDALPDSEGNDA